jgi:hypothetical protein
MSGTVVVTESVEVRSFGSRSFLYANLRNQRIVDLQSHPRKIPQNAQMGAD